MGLRRFSFQNSRMVQVDVLDGALAPSAMRKFVSAIAISRWLRACRVHSKRNQVRFSDSSIQFSSKRPQPGVWGLNRRAPNRLPANVPISRGFQLNRSLVSVDTSRMALQAEDCKRRAHLLKAQLQRLRLAAGDQSHNCRNLDRDLLVEYVDRLRLRAPKAYSGLAGPA